MKLSLKIFFLVDLKYCGRFFCLGAKKNGRRSKGPSGRDRLNRPARARRLPLYRCRRMFESHMDQLTGFGPGPISAGWATPKARRNRLLLALSPPGLSLLEPWLERVPLPVGTRLVEPNTPIEHAYFLEQGIASVVDTTPQGRRIEVGIIGREGLTGIPILLGADRTSHECIIQTTGEGLRIRADDLRRAMAASPSLRQHLLRFVQAFTVQVGQTALSNGRHTLEQRLARWLLMCHDRVDGDTLSMTHEFMSLMLGGRRAGVTVALQALEERDLITTKRGQVTVLDRTKLEAIAGDSSGVPQAEYTRLIELRLGPSSGHTVQSPALFEVPLFEIKAPTTVGQRSFVSITERQCRPARVLLVEDVKTKQILARAILKGAGQEVDVAERGTLAVQAVQREDDGLVLMDLRLAAMGQMASVLAHELNQPLAAASNYLSAAKRLPVGDGSRATAFVDKAGQHACRRDHPAPARLRSQRPADPPP